VVRLKKLQDTKVNGTDALSTRTRAENYSNYVKTLNSSSNNADFNTVDPNRATDEQSSYIINGVGLTLGLKYSL
jgi:hypothetical protein